MGGAGAGEWMGGMGGLVVRVVEVVGAPGVGEWGGIYR